MKKKTIAKLGQKKQIRKGLESENPSKIEKKSSKEAVCITIFYQKFYLYIILSQQFDFQLIGKLKKMHIHSFFIQKQLLLMIFTFLSVIIISIFYHFTFQNLVLSQILAQNSALMVFFPLLSNFLRALGALTTGYLKVFLGFGAISLLLFTFFPFFI